MEAAHKLADTDFIYKITAALDTALHERDEYTHSHSSRVIEIAAELGRKFCLSRAEMNILQVSARFHDIGKIGIPDSILLKPGKLTDEEFDVIKSHSLIGATIFSKIDLPDIEDYTRIILHHHEHMDGSGYPDRLMGDDIPLCSRIITVADCYDALTSRRSYRDSMPNDVAFAIMKEETGSHFDPRVVEKFFSLIK